MTGAAAGGGNTGGGNTGGGNTGGGDTGRGLLFATASYVLWGGLPLYMKTLAHVSPLEVVAHRVVWSVPVAGAVLLLAGRAQELRAALSSPRMVAMAAVTAALISVNWAIYVWAIAAGKALDAALGYYINPLFSVVVGAVLLGETLSRLQMAAVALAALAVVVLTVSNGSVPVVALGLTVSFGLYAYFKRSLPIGPNVGFLLEVLILSVPAALFVIWLEATGSGHFLRGTPIEVWLLLGCGPVTAIPLILYAYGAKGLRLSTIGMLQYIAPTLIFLVAVLLFREPFGPAERIAFPMIWGALILYSVSMIPRRSRRGPQKIVPRGSA